MKTVAVLGGGIAGLAAAERIAHEAKGRGLAVRAVVLEAAPVVGGKILTERHAGFVVESGPHGFLDKEPIAMRTIDRLGLTGALVRANPAAAKRYVLRDGRLVLLPASPPKFLRSPILSLGGKLRVALEPVARRAPAAEESVRDFAVRRIGAEAADVLVDAMVTGIYGGDPARLSVAAAFPRLVEIEAKYGSLIKGQVALAKEKKTKGFGGPAGEMYSFAEGLGTLIGALAKAVEVKTGAVARALERRGEGFEVVLDGDRISADAVVLATPAREMAGLVAGLDGGFASQLAGIHYAPVAVVVEGFAASDVRPEVLDGFGFLVPHREGRAILGTIFASSVFVAHAPAGQVMLRTILGGRRNPAAAEGDDATLVARARAELAALVGLGSGAKASFQRVFRWAEGIPQYELGHRERVRAADALEARVPGLAIGGNGLRGVAMIQCLADAERIAGRLLPRLGG